ncbi:PREDICTED: UPF0692 protein C19orf54 homolog isoform X2 [Priapulus caudatus]|nr:PREDICTED: UPF0692 protein C19orf54 homolog isoform X2 [Priapulus caudatus]
MEQLAHTSLGCETAVLKECNKKTEIVISLLQGGSLLLVPYDSDFNHRPCCKKGHKAHWAVITGVLIIVSRSDLVMHHFRRDQSQQCLYHRHMPVRKDCRCPPICPRQIHDAVFVYAREGKSRCVQYHVHVYNVQSVVSLREKIGGEKASRR